MAIHKHKLSPRQKMINLMYVVLMAMLALNVSSDVLNGFSLVDEMLNRKVGSGLKENNTMMANLLKEKDTNDNEDIDHWIEEANKIKADSEDLYKFVEQLKWDIVRYADGDEADLYNIQSQENLEAGTYIMLSNDQKNGKELKRRIDKFSEIIKKMPYLDQHKKDNICKNLDTTLPERGVKMGKNWQEYMFENIPVAATVVLLTKIQDDVLYAEGEVLHAILSSAKINPYDFNVNDVMAFVIPDSRTVNQGEKYSAQIVIAAVDKQADAEIYVDGKRLDSKDGYYEELCNTVGEHTLTGYVRVPKRDGSYATREFLQTFNVLEKKTTNTKADAEGKDDIGKANRSKIGFATVSATLMNVLYAGFDNPISISVSGADHVSATMTGGVFHDLGNGKYTAVPAAVGQDVVISVNASVGGHTEHIGDFPFRVRKLPDPTPYFQTGADDHFKGGAISKQAIQAIPGIHAAIDDGLLNIPFTVTGFKLICFDKMGNAVVEASGSSSFTPQQKAQIADMQRGKRFYITEVHAIGPDKIPRTLPGAMEVIVR